jgi:3-deoxy-7-phosphoheptulonate synthase
MSLAAMAAGADGVMIEVHHNPSEALCDKDQAMSPDMFAGMMRKLEVLGSCMKEINNETGHQDWIAGKKSSIALNV